MNTTKSVIYLVTIPGRLDPHYAFTNREDAERFAHATGHDDLEPAELPLIPGGGGSALDALIAQEAE